MSKKRTNLDSFDIDLSLFDGASDKIIEKPPRKSMPTPEEASDKIFGTSGLGASYEGPNDDNKYLDKVIYEASADGRLQTMPETISDAPNYQPNIPKQQKVQYNPKNVPVESLPKSSHVPRYGDDWHDRYTTPLPPKSSSGPLPSEMTDTPLPPKSLSGPRPSEMTDEDYRDLYHRTNTPFGGGASRKMRKSRKTKKPRRARRVKTQMRRKNSSRKSTRRRTRK